MRITFELPPKVVQRIEQLRDRPEGKLETGDIIRRALAVYEFVIQHTQAGGKVAIVRPSEKGLEITYAADIK